MCVCVYIFLFYAQDTQCLVFVSRAIFAYSMRKKKKKKKNLIDGAPTTLL